MPCNIFVTGAAGYLGRELCNDLAADSTNVVTALVRPSFNTKYGLDEKINLVTGDIRFKESYESHLQGVDLIFHLAAKMGGTELDEYLETNLYGTENLIKAALAASPNCQFIYISSTATLLDGESGKNEPLTETDKPNEMGLSHYGRSKLMAERLIIECHKKQNLNYEILRPSTVYGNSDEGLLENLFLDVKAKRVAPVLGNVNKTSYTHIDHFIEVCRECLETGTNNRIRHIVDEPALSYNEIVSYMYQEIYQPVPVRKWFAFEARIRAIIGMVIAKRDGRKTSLTKSRLKTLLDKAEFTSIVNPEDKPKNVFTGLKQTISDLKVLYGLEK
jgi:nucleoside-diphosphate-sugar epimerase